MRRTLTEHDMKCWAMIGFVRSRIIEVSQMNPNYDHMCASTYNNWLSATQREMLRQLVEHGPVWDGDVASKAARDDLLEAHLASRACVKGEQGYTVATYRGWDVYKRGVETKEAA